MLSQLADAAAALASKQEIPQAKIVPKAEPPEGDSNRDPATEVVTAENRDRILRLGPVPFTTPIEQLPYTSESIGKKGARWKQKPRRFPYQLVAEFPGLEYSPSADMAFCFACRVHLKGRSADEPLPPKYTEKLAMVQGIRHWFYLKQNTTRHWSSAVHKESTAAYELLTGKKLVCQEIPRPTTPILQVPDRDPIPRKRSAVSPTASETSAAALSPSSAKKRPAPEGAEAKVQRKPKLNETGFFRWNRSFIWTAIRAMHWLAKEGYPIQPTEAETFHNLLCSHGPSDPKWDTDLKYYFQNPSLRTYFQPEMQKRLFAIFANQLQRVISKYIRASRTPFSLFIESFPRGSKMNLAIVVRYIDGTADQKIVERLFAGTQLETPLTEDSLLAFVADVFARTSLPLAFLAGMNFDELCTPFCGKLWSRVHVAAPNAIAVWNSTRSNDFMVLSVLYRACPQVNAAFETINSVAQFFNKIPAPSTTSATTLALPRFAQLNRPAEIPLHAPHRWSPQFLNTFLFLEQLGLVFFHLESLSDNSKEEAKLLLNRLRNFEFLLLARCIGKVLPFVMGFLAFLQEPSIVTTADLARRIQPIRKALHELRNEVTQGEQTCTFETVVEDTELLCDEYEISRPWSTGSVPVQQYRTTMWEPLFDGYLRFLHLYFGEHSMRTYEALEILLKPCQSDSISVYEPLLQHPSQQRPSIAPQLLEQQHQSVSFFLPSLSKDSCTVMMKQMSECGKEMAFSKHANPAYFRLLCMAATYPCVPVGTTAKTVPLNMPASFSVSAVAATTETQGKWERVRKSLKCLPNGAISWDSVLCSMEGDLLAKIPLLETVQEFEVGVLKVEETADANKNQ